MDHIDGFLTSLATAIHKEALVMKIKNEEDDKDRFESIFILRIPGREDVGLGPTFPAARKSLTQLRNVYKIERRKEKNAARD